MVESDRVSHESGPRVCSANLRGGEDRLMSLVSANLDFLHLVVGNISVNIVSSMLVMPLSHDCSKTVDLVGLRQTTSRRSKQKDVVFMLTDAQSFSNNCFVLQLVSNHLKYCRVGLRPLTA